MVRVWWCVVRCDGEGGVVSLGLPQLGVKTRLQDFGLMYSRHNCEWLRVLGGSATVAAQTAHSPLPTAAIRFARPTRTQWVIFFAGKLSHVMLRFGIPMMFMPLPTLVSPSQLSTLPVPRGSTVPPPTPSPSLLPPRPALLHHSGRDHRKLLAGADLPGLPRHQRSGLATTRQEQLCQPGLVSAVVAGGRQHPTSSCPLLYCTGQSFR